MADWVHCNVCYRAPTATTPFLMTSCGHILCKKCATAPGGGANRECGVCKKQCGYTEVNRNLKPEMQILFRNPRDLAAQYMKNLGQVLDFQAFNKGRLTKFNAEREKKAVKFAQGAQQELLRRAEIEKKALQEKMQLECEVEKTRARCKELEAKLQSNEEELERLRSMGSIFPPLPRADSGLGTDSSLSFMDVATSTPLPGRSPASRYPGTRRLDEIFKAQHGSVPSPIVKDSPMDTPAMLGLKKKPHRRSSSASSRAATESSPFGIAFEMMEVDNQRMGF